MIRVRTLAPGDEAHGRGVPRPARRRVDVPALESARGRARGSRRDVPGDLGRGVRRRHAGRGRRARLEREPAPAGAVRARPRWSRHAVAMPPDDRSRACSASGTRSWRRARRSASRLEAGALRQPRRPVRARPRRRWSCPPRSRAARCACASRATATRAHVARWRSAYRIELLGHPADDPEVDASSAAELAPLLQQQGCFLLESGRRPGRVLRLQRALARLRAGGRRVHAARSCAAAAMPAPWSRARSWRRAGRARRARSCSPARRTSSRAAPTRRWATAPSATSAIAFF